MLLDLLSRETEQRDGLLDAWRQLVVADSERALSLLEMLVGGPDQGRADVWCRALWGLREKSKSDLTGRLLTLLNRVSDELFLHPDFSQAVAEIVQAISSAAEDPELALAFWELFERSLRAASENSSNIAGSQPNDWVGYAINCSMGHLAQAFFTALFARHLKVNAGIPTDLVRRLNELVGPSLTAHRPARVIAASRLSYLYAVDPAWVAQALLPGLQWDDEEEALALWQGFAWQPRIDPQLWAAIKVPFLELFTSERLDRLGDFRRNFAQLLALAGIEFGVEELPRDRVRNAIRAMPKGMQQDVIAWISGYLEQQREADADDTVAHAAVESDVDVLWRMRVAPWLKRVWPADPAIRSGEISEQFALAAIATDTAFPEALVLITPYLVKTQYSTVLRYLAASEHPDKHPQEAMALIGKLISPGVPLWGPRDLRDILDRIAASDPVLVEDAMFQRWSEQVRLQER